MNKIEIKNWWYVLLLLIAGSSNFVDFFTALRSGSNFELFFALLFFILKFIIILFWAYNSKNFIILFRIYLLLWIILTILVLTFFSIFYSLEFVNNFDPISKVFVICVLLIFIILLVFSGKQIQYVKPIVSDENFQSGRILKESNQQLEQKLTFRYPWYNALIVLGFMYSIFNTTTVILENTFLITGIIVLLLKTLAIYYFYENSKYFTLIFRVLCLFYVLPFLFHLLKILYRVLILDQSFVHHFNFYFQLIILLYFSALFIESWGRIKLEWIKTPSNLEQSE